MMKKTSSVKKGMGKDGRNSMRLCLVAEFPHGSFSDLLWTWCAATDLWSLELTPFPNRADAWLALISTGYVADEREGVLEASQFHGSGRNLPLVLFDDRAGTVEVFGPLKPDGTRDLWERWDRSDGASGPKIGGSVFSPLRGNPEGGLPIEKASPTEEQALRKRRTATAQLLRARLRGMIPTTWEEYAAFPLRLSAYEAIRIVQEKTGASFEEAWEAVESEIPELFAGYWHSLPEEDETKD